MRRLLIVALIAFLPIASSAIAAASTVRVVYDFGSRGDGANPSAELVSDRNGVLYGTTSNGGPLGCGTVFALTPAGNGFTERVLYRFTGKGDGENPVSTLLLGRNGTLYGTTEGNYGVNDGNVFALTPSANGYTEAIVYQFHGPDGRFPETGLVADAAGDLFGTTAGGGAQDDGTVFELERTAQGFAYHLLYDFNYPVDFGFDPRSPLQLGNGGVIYGTATDSYFELVPGKSGYAKTELYNFRGNNIQGLISTPVPGLLGDLVGTSNTGGETYGKYFNTRGVIFSLRSTPSGFVEKNAHEFGAHDGNFPNGQLLSTGGALYGTTYLGGLGDRPDEYHNGVVFKMVAAHGRYVYNIVHVFEGKLDGAAPFAGLILAPNGKLYGTTLYGGPFSSGGTVYEVTP